MTQFFTDQMLFLTFKQQCQSTEGNIKVLQQSQKNAVWGI